MIEMSKGEIKRRRLMMQVDRAMKLLLALVVVIVAAMSLTSCVPSGSDERQRDEEEKILMEAMKSVGMPAIKNFRERRLLKDILELRDQANLLTFTYLQAMSGKLVFLCNSVGYGIPYATQYTNPQKPDRYRTGSYFPQADPNGLFSPSAADGTWVMCKDLKSADVKPVFIEPRIVVSQFKLEEESPAAPTPAPPVQLPQPAHPSASASAK